MAWTRERYCRLGYPPYRWVVNETVVPLALLGKPLAEARIGLISSGGIVWHDQPPFSEDKNDLTFREIPKDAPLSEMRIFHNARYYVREPQYDLNCVLPLDRLRELEAEGFIGELASPVYTFMGRIFTLSRLHAELIPRLLERLRAQRVDAVLLCPV
jgi:D-proline reductase (dithiol) PrdB